MLTTKTDWKGYLASLRRREISLVFGLCPADAFEEGLELGAADGAQSVLLARFTRRLTATDYRSLILTAPPHHKVTHRVCDAERVDDVFERGRFDLIFSSNTMEHLPDPQRALAGMHSVLRDDGLAIHLMPSPFWKACHIVGFYPNWVISRMQRLRRQRESARRRQRKMGTSAAGPAENEEAWNNNPKLGRRYGYMRRLLAPTPHGIAASNIAEFAAFSPRRWQREFAATGFRVATLLPGPVSSGYGFGFDGLRRALERIGVASEYAYVTLKAGSSSPHLTHFIRR